MSKEIQSKSCEPGDGADVRLDRGEAPERNLGEQPLAAILRERGLSRHDLVAASPVPINHKMVARAERGRRLTIHSKDLIITALNRATGENFRREDLFNY